TKSVSITVAAASGGGGTATPVKIGAQIGGARRDQAGHSGQSHLVYAPNSGIWWLFTLSSAHDAFGDQTVQAYRSNGPDLSTPTWPQGATGPNMAMAGGRPNPVMG